MAYTPTTTEQPTTIQILPGPPSTVLPPTQTATQPASQEEFYINHHRLDENGHEWPKPRRIEKCNRTDDVDDDVMDDFSAASSIFVHVRVVIVTLISVLFTFSFVWIDFWSFYVTTCFEMHCGKAKRKQKKSAMFRPKHILQCIAYTGHDVKGSEVYCGDS